VEWGGGAVDPATQTYVVNTSSVAMIYQLLDRQTYQALNHAGDRANYYAQSGPP
jgi:quinoprotein glucose dehydrogenase